MAGGGQVPSRIGRLMINTPEILVSLRRNKSTGRKNCRRMRDVRTSSTEMLTFSDGRPSWLRSCLRRFFVPLKWKRANFITCSYLEGHYVIIEH